MIVVRSRSNVMFALVTGFPLESRYIIWMFLSIMGFVSRRPTAFIKLLDIQMKITFYKQLSTGDTHRLFGDPKKELFWISSSFKKYCERSRNTKILHLGLYYTNFLS